MDLPNFQNAKEWWQAFKTWPPLYRILAGIIIIALVYILVFRPNPTNFFKRETTKVSETPMFSVLNPNVRVGSEIVIIAENSAANFDRPLKVEYDGVVFSTGAIPFSGTKRRQHWYFRLSDKVLTEEMLKEGTHELRFSFFGDDFSNSSKKIIISKKTPAPFIDLPKLDTSTLEKAKVQTIEVHTARDFIKAINPNTVIKLAKGIYNLSIASQVKNKYVEWVDAYDGPEPLIHSVYNLTIVGETGSKILIDPKYAWVISFQNSKNIKIQNVIIGHNVSGFCEGGVLSFINSEDVEINNSVLFGCGTTGIQVDKVDHLKFSNSTVKDCTYNLIGIFNSTNIVFENSTFENTGQYNLISISDFTYNVKFSNCLIRGGWTGDYEPYLINIGEKAADIYLVDSKIIGNKTMKFVNQLDRLTMRNNVFLGNSFTDFSDDELNQYLHNGLHKRIGEK